MPSIAQAAWASTVAISVAQRRCPRRARMREVIQHDGQFVAGVLQTAVLPIDHANLAGRSRENVVSKEVAMTALQCSRRFDQTFELDQTWHF
jgi:hypothetical protein